MSQRTSAAVCGAAGRMGREVIGALLEAGDIDLRAAIDRQHCGEDAAVLAGKLACGVLVEADLRQVLERTRPEVVVDFSVPDAVLGNAITALECGTRPVIGATGLGPDELKQLDSMGRELGLPVFVAPNFAIGAVLMMRFAEQAARFLPDVEIIELHHDRKLDSPSGTALLTAQRIEAARREAGRTALALPENCVEKAPGARGARHEITGGVPVHSVRLPGFVAHQEVIFGGTGQTLTLRHDSIDRSSFMPGVVLAARRVASLPPGLTLGLEKLLE